MRAQSFDVVKAFACVAVVLIHYNFPGEMGKSVKAFCTFAVPTFFMISGYFLPRVPVGEILPVEKIFGRVRKLFKLLFVSTLGYAVFFWVHDACLNQGTFMNVSDFCVKYLTAAKLAKFLVTNDGLFNVMLWFFGALIYCYFVILFFLRTERRLRRSWWSIPVLWVSMCLIQEFAKVVGFNGNFLRLAGVSDRSVLVLSSCFLFRALPFFLFGTFLRSSAERVRTWNVPNWFFLSLAFLGGCIAVAEYWMLGHRIAQFYLGSYLAAVSLLIWAIRATDVCAPKLAFIGCELSMLVYVLQVLGVKLVDALVKAGNLYATLQYKWTRGVLALGVTFALALFINWFCNWFCRLQRRIKG